MSLRPFTSSKRYLAIGREREIGAIDRVLEQRQSALVVVSGGIGVGKTCVLSNVEERAVRAGWRRIERDSLGFVSVSEETTSATLLEWMRSALLLKENETTGIVFATNSGPASPIPPQALSPPDATKGPASNQVSDGTPALDTRPPSDLPQPPVKQTPLLVVIDGYRPHPQFEEWFTGTFIPGLKQNSTPVVVLIAETIQTLQRLIPLADEHIGLEPLDAAVVRRHFESVSQTLEPSLSKTELDRYVAVVCQNVGVLLSLTVALELARRRNS